jgi:hypothetical protein
MEMKELDPRENERRNGTSSDGSWSLKRTAELNKKGNTS